MTHQRWQYRLFGRHIGRLGFRLVRVANRLRVGVVDACEDDEDDIVRISYPVVHADGTTSVYNSWEAAQASTHPRGPSVSG